MSGDKMKDETYTTQPTSQLDLEDRYDRDFNTVQAVEVDPNAVDTRYAVEGNDTSAYRGVSPEYMTYASDTEKPLSGDGVEDTVADEMLSGFAFAAPEVTETSTTVGGGSSSPVVYATTSGSGVETLVVEADSDTGDTDTDTDTDTATDTDEDESDHPEFAPASPAPTRTV